VRENWVRYLGHLPRRVRAGGKSKTAEGISDPVVFARERLGFKPDEKQIQVLRGGRRGIVNCTRQWGKSTVTAAKAVHRAYSVPESLTLVLAPCGRQSGEFVRKAKQFVAKLGMRAPSDGNNGISIGFPNGSRIVGLPDSEATIRGFSAASLILIDEASRVRDETYEAIRPMLAVGDGDLWLMSTPCGERGFFWEEWDQGTEGWERISVKAPDCPRISKRVLEEARAKGHRLFAQEYLCEFVEREGAVFPRELIEAAMQDFEPLDL
jgi:hypothetical protein